jgi:hypothetical protein
VPTTPRLIVIVKRRPYDEAQWKRLLLAYACALYDRARLQTPKAAADAGEVGSE